ARPLPCTDPGGADRLPVLRAIVGRGAVAPSAVPLQDLPRRHRGARRHRGRGCLVDRGWLSRLRGKRRLERAPGPYGTRRASPPGGDRRGSADPGPARQRRARDDAALSARPETGPVGASGCDEAGGKYGAALPAPGAASSGGSKSGEVAAELCRYMVARHAPDQPGIEVLDKLLLF